MIIQIIGNANDSAENLSFLHTIVETVHDNDVSIARDWIGRAQNRLSKGIVRDSTKNNWDGVHQEIEEAITRADIIIVEASNFDFKEGFYTSQALEQ
jgi:hypothetical protein